MSNGTVTAKASGIAVIQALGILVSLFGISGTQCVRAQAIPMDNCRALATIEATTDRRRLRFLVDTGATSSLLNAKSFPQGDAAHVVVHSWNGAFSAEGRKVGISDLTIGGRHLNAMSFLAVDLSDLERECGKEIDGIMGADLIRELGLEIDLKKRVARFAEDPKHEEKEFTDLGEQLELCRAAFGRSDVKAIGDCLDPDVVLVISGKSYRGRDAILKYFDHEYFGDGRSTTMSIDRSTFYATADGVWLEYELSIRFHNQATRERGAALFQKSGRKWLVVSLNGSDPREELTHR